MLQLMKINPIDVVGGVRPEYPRLIKIHYIQNLYTIVKMRINQQIAGQLKLPLFSLRLQKYGNGSQDQQLMQRLMLMTRLYGINQPFQRSKNKKLDLIEILKWLMLPIEFMQRAQTRVMKEVASMGGVTGLMSGFLSILQGSSPSIARPKRVFLTIQTSMMKLTVK